MAPRRPVVLVPGLLGVVVGSALQIQQPTLWTAAGYAATGAAGVALALGALRWRATFRPRGAFFLVLVAFALAVFALCGLRSLHYASTALD
ncbi:MAG: competence protein ComEC, partial [Burkholderiales bacterium]|nr:competence protein ComEC [Burkholderiales bacterium]